MVQRPVYILTQCTYSHTRVHSHTHAHYWHSTVNGVMMVWQGNFERLGHRGGGEIYTSSTSTTMGIMLSLNCQVLERHIWDVKLKWKISSYLLTILNYIADNRLTPVYLTCVGGVVKTLIVPVLKVLKIKASLRFAWIGYITYIPNANLVKQKRKGLIN